MSSSLDLRSLLPEGWRRNRVIKSLPKKKPRRVNYIDPVFKSASTREPPLVCYIDGRGYLRDEMAKSTAEKALSFYNQTSLSNQGPEYELVKPLHCMFTPYHCTYHCNFIARIKINHRDDDHDYDNGEILFFAEMKIISHKYVHADDDEPLRCLVCCIIGPRFTRTGERGCWSCKKHRGLIQHPQDISSTYWKRGRECADKQ